MQAKRIQVDVNVAVAVGSAHTTEIEVPLEPREEVNFHNIHASCIIEPVLADANSSGFWVLYVIPEGGAPIFFNAGTLDSELNNRFIIAVGTWSASNQSPFNSGDINPKTSRTLNAGDKLAFGVSIQNTTAGNSLVETQLSAHTTRK